MSSRADGRRRLCGAAAVTSAVLALSACAGGGVDPPPAPTLDRTRGTVDVRVWQSTAEGRSYVMAARVLGSMGGGMMAMVTCPAGAAASDEYKEVVKKMVRVSVARPSTQ